MDQNKRASLAAGGQKVVTSQCSKEENGAQAYSYQATKEFR
jgi:hypothetical protein